MKYLSIIALMTWAAVVAGCGNNRKTPTSPSSTTSSLTYQVPAAATHAAASGDYTNTNADFYGSVRTTCVPNPNIAGSVCPDLMVRVQPITERFCQLWIFAPVGETLAVRSYPVAERSAGAGVAGLSFNCAKGGTTCNTSVGQFTLRELQSNASGVITRLHITFEQTCTGGFPLSTAGFGKLTAELRIINGTMPF